MTDEEIARCQQAIDLANAGQTSAAYEQFCALYPGNEQDVTLHYWLAYTTPVLREAQNSLDVIARVEPGHPKLQELRAYVSRKQQRYGYEGGMLVRMTPTLTCPYCHVTGPAIVRQKIAVAGWIFFGVVLVLFFPLCWIGLLMKEPYYVCSSCGITLGNRG